MDNDGKPAIADQLRTFIRQTFKIPPDDQEFNDDIHLFDYGYVDSFGAVELTAFVEKAFGTHISEADLVAYPLNTINEIAEFVCKRRKGAV